MKFIFTQRVHTAVNEDHGFAKDIVESIKKFCRNDWGTIEAEDKQINENALKNGGRIFGAYTTCQGKIYIITEWDKSATTVLFSDEY